MLKKGEMQNRLNDRKDLLVELQKAHLDDQSWEEKLGQILYLGVVGPSCAKLKFQLTLANYLHF